MTAALTAARRGCSVTLLERNQRTGKKLLSTGNGRCNYTNRDLRPECYRSETPQALRPVLYGFGTGEAVEFLRSLGIEPAFRGDYCYPMSGQASSVTEGFDRELKRLGVRVVTGAEVTSAWKRDGRFSVTALVPDESAARGKDPGRKEKGAVPGRPGKKRKDELDLPSRPERFSGDSLILACGSPAGIAEKNRTAEALFGGYRLAEGFGHSVTELLPALTGLVCRHGCTGVWAGVRTQACVRIESCGRVLAADTGEVQLTDYGISGIPVFQVSRFAAKALSEGNPVLARLDFFPDFSEAALLALLEARGAKLHARDNGELLTGLLNSRLIPVFREGGKALAASLKNFRLPVEGVNPLSTAQVCAGGVRLDEIDPDTMESRLVPGLFLTGELLDADGICGGYNLHWAWATGTKAGKNA